ncbi:hypothetical protein BDV25DRAFT_143482 [Aspergillus avenaceus]|uniref:F-box domain-containing protein n=1 Tax=Aspergillus avenaceus TaxID=36643 RepID=A0A5N6TJY6_ASPAV|nr:hypothetical protein BDV25DRAFT_143482 [Aspergillus avenaceus]
MHTDYQTNPTYQNATETALSTPEILEMILLQVDLRTLLTSTQRVCKFWTSTIQTSPLIQEALFFKPTSNTQSFNGRVIYNPLLAQAFPLATPPKPKIKMAYRYHEMDMIKNQKKHQYMRKEASWRRMLLRQPPAYNVSFFIQGDYRLLNGNGNGDREGLRMGPFFEMFVLSEELSWHDCEIIWKLDADSRMYDINYEAGPYARTEWLDMFTRAMSESDVMILRYEGFQFDDFGEVPYSLPDAIKDQIKEAYGKVDGDYVPGGPEFNLKNPNLNDWEQEF